MTEFAGQEPEDEMSYASIYIYIYLSQIESKFLSANEVFCPTAGRGPPKKRIVTPPFNPHIFLHSISTVVFRGQS